jgi:predicted HD phosphohydrolase
MFDKTVDFIHMADGTAEEYAMLAANEAANPVAVADNAMGLLKGLIGHNYGNKIDRYRHSLQTATRAHRDGADEEMTVVALLHDIGDMYAPHNHSAFAAAVLRPYISDDNHWLVLHHGIFQGYFYFHHYDRDRDAREQFRGHAMFEKTADFCERWDQTSFDPDYETMALEDFEPMVRRVIARPSEKFI